MSARHQSVIVYGPQGCGKTRNAAKLQRKLGLSRVLDLGADLDTETRVMRGRMQLPHQDTLVLTSLTRDELQRAGVRLPLLPYADVMAGITNGTRAGDLLGKAGA